MEEMRVYSGFLGMERNKRAGHSMEMKPEARVACQVMLAVLFTALFITAIAFAGECRSFSLTVQAFQPHAQPCFQCPFDWIRYRGKCYYFSEVEGNWTSSQDNCSALGASLAILDSVEDLSFVMRYKGISEHWIGLFREHEQQPWQWVNRSALSHLLSEMGLHLPSGLPKELKKSLSSCCHQSDVLWEALEKLRASVLGQPSPGISGFRPNQQLASVVAAVQELAPLPVQDLCHRHQRPLTVFVTTMEFLSAPPAPSIEPTPLCCSKRPLAATGRLWRDGISQPVCETCSAQKLFEASLKTLQEEDKPHAGLTEAAKETRQEMLTRVSADKQKLRAMLKGLHWVLSDQESQFLSQFHRPCWRLQEQQHGQGAEMSWIQQGHAGLQAKCQQPDGNVLWDV
ncbi:uncharacterized protein LOC135289525 isoform X2 [Passer domesticus]|uniref:uncharacterized protein LOC135289525 isoform X2 n=1 Tax=Passer domesticus TaxID=48849 RepID=UPI0030FE345A